MEKILFSSLAIEDKVLELADKLNKLYPNEPKALHPVLTPILQGGITFFQDVAKNLLFEAYVDCVGVVSYKGQDRGEINLYKDWNVDLTDKDVWLIDDICDSGKTMAFLQQRAYDKGAKRVYKATLLERHNCPMELDFSGFTLKDEWVFGYGMDHPDGLGRLSDSIFKV
tara:strand:+ start:86 stop:592 length:507 start_codon:yes stop_codon:yes gene_type:complete